MWNVEVGMGVMVGVMMSVGLRGNGKGRMEVMVWVR